MENISKALIAIGTIIITILLMTLLWNVYTNFQQINKIDDETKKFEQDIEYDKKFQSYNYRTVDGVEILSLYNLVEDYNLRKASSVNSLKLDVIIKITKGNDYLKAGEYSIKEINTKYDYLEQEISNMLKVKYLKFRSVDYFAELALEELYELKSLYPEDLKDIESKIELYNSLKSKQDFLKQKKFKCSNIEYKDQSIVKMVFTE